MADGAVCAKDNIVRTKRLADARRHRFLSLALVERSWDFSLQKEPIQMLFVPANEHHLLIHAEHLLRRYGLGCAHLS
jgi:hypothetical protein